MVLMVAIVHRWSVRIVGSTNVEFKFTNQENAHRIFAKSQKLSFTIDSVTFDVFSKDGPVVLSSSNCNTP